MIIPSNSWFSLYTLFSAFQHDRLDQLEVGREIKLSCRLRVWHCFSAFQLSQASCCLASKHVFTLYDAWSQKKQRGQVPSKRGAGLKTGKALLIDPSQRVIPDTASRNCIVEAHILQRQYQQIPTSTAQELIHIPRFHRKVRTFSINWPLEPLDWHNRNAQPQHPQISTCHQFHHSMMSQRIRCAASSFFSLYLHIQKSVTNLTIQQISKISQTSYDIIWFRFRWSNGFVGPLPWPISFSLIWVEKRPNTRQCQYNRTHMPLNSKLCLAESWRCWTDYDRFPKLKTIYVKTHIKVWSIQNPCALICWFADNMRNWMEFIHIQPYSCVALHIIQLYIDISMISWCTHLLHCPSHVLPQCFRAGPFVLPLVWCEVRAWLWINLGKRAACASTMVKKRWCSERCFLCVYIILYVFCLKKYDTYYIYGNKNVEAGHIPAVRSPPDIRARTDAWKRCTASLVMVDLRCGRCGSRDAGTAVTLIRSKKEVQLPNQVSW